MRISGVRVPRFEPASFGFQSERVTTGLLLPHYVLNYFTQLSLERNLYFFKPLDVFDIIEILICDIIEINLKMFLKTSLIQSYEFEIEGFINTIKDFYF